MAVRYWTLAFLVLVGGVGCSGSPSGQPPGQAETQIVMFEVSPDRVEPGGVVVVSWRAVDVGRVDGEPYCTLQWTVRDRDPEELLEVGCEGSRDVVVPEEETAVQFQFSALRSDGATYVTRSRTVTVAPLIVSFVVSPDRVEPGGVVVVSWRAVDVGRVDGVPYCTLQWTVRDRDPEELLEVGCEGSLEVVVPEEETAVRFQFSALRPDGETYVTRSRTVVVTAVNDDPVTVDCDAATPLTDDITVDTTLPLDCYLVSSNVTVSAALTLLPGAVLEFESSAGLRVADGGSLRADGTSSNPIRFRSRSGDSDGWRGVGIFTSSANNVLDHVIVENAGRSWRVINGNNATNLFLGPNGRAAITNSIFRSAGNNGVGVYAASRTSEFGAFADNRFDDNEGAAMQITSHQIGQIGAGNVFDLDGRARPGAKHVRVASDGELRASATWPAADVPYRFFGNHFVDDAGAVITIEAGATLEFDRSAGMAVDAGALRAEGTSTAPVTFTSASGDPDDWRGVGIFSSSSQNLFDHAVVANAGRPWSVINRNNAANVVVGANAVVAITNSTFATAGNDGVGLHVDAGSSVLSVFESNTFDANERAAMQITSRQLGSIGAGSTFFTPDTRAAARHIRVTSDGDLVSSATWRAVDVPYRFFGNHFVDDRAAVITILPGARLEFDGGAGLRVNAGALRAVGMSDDRIVFTSASGNPNDWRGLGIASNSDENVLDFVTMENAGRTWSTINRNRPTNLFVNEFSKVVVTNSAFNDSGGWGIFVWENGEVTNAAGDVIDPAAEGGNTFSGNVSGDVGLQ